MNEAREQIEETPEGRLAAVAVTTMHTVQRRPHHMADFADFKEALRLPVARELLIVRLEEAQRGGLLARARELLTELEACERRLTGHEPT